MKISIILPDLRPGGVERMRLYLAAEWLRRGYEVEFVLLRKRGALLDLHSKLVPEAPIFELGVDKMRSSIMPLSAHLRRSRPNIVLAAMWPLTSICVMAWGLSGRIGKIYLSDHTRLSISCIKEANKPLLYLKTLVRITYPFATRIITVSKGIKQDLCECCGIPFDRVEVIYNPAATGVTPNRESVLVQNKLWGDGFKYHVLSVGTLKEQKDHETLIRAFSKIAKNINAKLTIVGEGPLRLSLENLIVELGLQERVFLHGYAADPYLWFRSADLFVLSSRWEGFGNVIVEALECGVPVVSTDCASGPAEILENGRYGKMVPVGNINALAEAMTASLSKQHDRDLLINRAKDFSVERISDKYLACFGVKNND